MRFIKDFPDYAVTRSGKVFSRKSNKYLRDADNGNGYRYVSLRRGGKSHNCYVHRLVAKTYFGDSDLPVNHKDGDKSNNSESNLEFVTPSENTIHGFATGLMKTCPVSLHSGGVGYWFPTQKAAAKFLNVSKSAINAVVKGRNKTILNLKLS